MGVISEIFNNRELAFGFYLILFFVIIMINREFRRSVPNILTSFLKPTLLTYFMITSSYIILLIYLLSIFGIWNLEQLKNTLIWFVTVGIFSFKHAKLAKGNKYLLLLIIDNIKALVLLEYIVNLYSFPIIIELILLPFVTILLLIKEVTNLSASIKNYINATLATICFIALFHSTKILYINIDQINLVELFKDFGTPLVLSLLNIMYIYFLIIYIRYEEIFAWINFMKTIEDSVKLPLKFKIMCFCNLDIYKITNFMQRSSIRTMSFKDTCDIEQLFNNYKSYHERQ